jgi:hypothetical protein
LLTRKLPYTTEFCTFTRKNILGGKPVPKPSYLDQCNSLGAIGGNKRWRSEDGKRLYTWDSLHGEIEVFNSRGCHLGVLDPDGNFIKEAVKGRKIDV